MFGIILSIVGTLVKVFIPTVGLPSVGLTHKTQGEIFRYSEVKGYVNHVQTCIEYYETVIKYFHCNTTQGLYEPVMAVSSLLRTVNSERTISRD